MPETIDNEFIFFERKKRSTPWKMKDTHFHDVHELYFLESGHTKYFIGNELYMLNPGDMIFVPKGVFHKTDSDESPATERILLLFNDYFIENDAAVFINELTENKHIKLPYEQIRKIRDILNKIENEQKNEEKNSKLMQKLYLNQLFILILRYRITENVPFSDTNHSIIQKAVKYISENYDADLSLTALSKKYAMSPSYFSRQFKSITGISLNEYINISRITAAEKLLLTTSMPITKIATKCGFNDSNYWLYNKCWGVQQIELEKN